MGSKNQVVSAICKTCKGDETPLVAWIQKCSSAKDPSEFASVGNYPVLDRTLGHELLENARGTRFSLDFQALQEKCQKEGKATFRPLAAMVYPEQVQPGQRSRCKP